MRNFIIAILASALLAACQWFAPAAPPADEVRNPQRIPAEAGPNSDPYAKPGESGGLCGGIAGFTCTSEKQYCYISPGECREIADAAGTCTLKPEICTMQYDPVCGCDGKNPTAMPAPPPRRESALPPEANAKIRGARRHARPDGNDPDFSLRT